MGIGAFFNHVMLPSKILARRPLVLWLVLAVAQLFALETVCAQSSPPLPIPYDSAFVGNLPTAADTIAAIQKVFKSRRQGGAWLIGGSAALIAFGSVSAATETKSFLGPNGTAVLLTIGTAPASILGIVKLIRFGSWKEKAIIIEYQQTHRLPPHLRKIIARGRVVHE